MGGEPPLPPRRSPARLGRRSPGVGDRARWPRPDLPGDSLQVASPGRRRDRRSGRGALLDPADDQGADSAAWAASRRIRRRTGSGAGDRLPRRPGPCPRGRFRLGGAGPRFRRSGSAHPAGRGLRYRRPGLRALARRHRRRDGGGRQERRRPGRRRRRAARAQRRRHRGCRDLERVHRVRDQARGRAGDLFRPRRGRRPDRDDDGPGRAQPPRRGAARHRHAVGRDPEDHRPGLGGTRHDAAAGRGRCRLRGVGRCPQWARRTDPRRDRRRGVGRRAAPGRAARGGRPDGFRLDR